MQVDVKAMTLASKKDREARAKEETVTDDKQQQRQTSRKWSNIMTSSLQKPLAKTTSAPPTAKLAKGSFKNVADTAQPIVTQTLEPAAKKVDGAAAKGQLHGILKQQASGMRSSTGVCI